MRPRWVSLFVVLAVSAGPLYSQVFRGRVMLKTDVAEVLPGLPVAFRAELSNDSPVPVPAPSTAALRVTPEGQTPFFARPLMSDKSEVRMMVESREPLQPGEVFRYSWSYEVLVQPWFTDERLSRPGTYELQLILLLEDASVDPGNTDLSSPEMSRNAYVSNPVSIRVLEPTSPADRAVWDRMRAAVSRDLWSNYYWGDHVWGLAKYIVDEHPTSGYFPYVALAYPARTNGKRLEIARAAAAKAPPASDTFAYLGLGYAKMVERVIANRRNSVSAESDAPDNDTLIRQATALLLEAQRAPIASDLKRQVSRRIEYMERIRKE